MRPNENNKPISKGVLKEDEPSENKKYKIGSDNAYATLLRSGCLFIV